MESNLNIKKPDTPKLNIETVSSAVFGKEDGAGGGSGESIKNIHKTLSKLSGHIRKSLIRIKALEFNLQKIIPKVEEVEKKVIVNTEKITRIKKILKEQKNNIGKKLPGSNQDDLNKSLIETNKILVQIQQELMRSSALRSEQEKNQISKQKKAASKAKLSKEESELEQSSKKLGSNIAKISDKILSPVKGIFGKIMDFVGTLALGFATNAIFEWLKDKENQEKVQGWFNWIKDHWKWVAAGIGVLFALPLVGAIGGVISTIGTLASVIGALATPLLGLMLNPLFWKILLAIGAGILIYKGGEWVIKGIRNAMTGGEDFSEAHSEIDEKLKNAGVVVRGRNAGKVRVGSGRKQTYRDPKDPEKIKLVKGLLDKRARLKSLAKEQKEEIELKKSQLPDIQTPRGRKKRGYVDPNIKARARVTKEVKESYIPKIQSIMGSGGIEARAMGGPVSAGTPYLVGENGPEIFSPNIDGSVVNNMRTEKIYEMITSKKRGRGGVNIQTLPTITNQLPPPEMQNMGVGDGATEVPNISSVNMADPYRQLTPMLYGITV